MSVRGCEGDLIDSSIRRSLPGERLSSEREELLAAEIVADRTVAAVDWKFRSILNLLIFQVQAHSSANSVVVELRWPFGN